MQTTRRFDALKVFMAFQTRGLDGYTEMMDKGVDNATYMYHKICGDPEFIAPVEPELSSIVFALSAGDEVNKKVRRGLLKEGIVIGQTVKDGKVMLKFTLLNPNLGHDRIDEIVTRIKELGRSC